MELLHNCANQGMIKDTATLVFIAQTLSTLFSFYCDIYKCPFDVGEWGQSPQSLFCRFRRAEQSNGVGIFPLLLSSQYKIPQ